MFAHGETITRLRGVRALDPYSGEESGVDWSDPVTGSIPGWAVDDSRTTEPLSDGRDPIVTDFVLYRDEPADVMPGDRVVVRGVTCEVVGRPSLWRNPFTGWRAGFVVKANAVEG